VLRCNCGAAVQLWCCGATVVLRCNCGAAVQLWCCGTKIWHRTSVQQILDCLAREKGQPERIGNHEISVMFETLFTLFFFVSFETSWFLRASPNIARRLCFSRYSAERLFSGISCFIAMSLWFKTIILNIILGNYASLVLAFHMT